MTDQQNEGKGLGAIFCCAFCEKITNDTKYCEKCQKQLDQIRREAVNNYITQTPKILKSALNSPLDEDVLAFGFQFSSELGEKLFSLDELTTAVQKFKNDKVIEAKKKLLDEWDNSITILINGLNESIALGKWYKVKEIVRKLHKQQTKIYRAKTLGKKEMKE